MSNRRPWSALIGMFIVTVALAAMCQRYWFRMPDPLMDYGREIYVPWRLSGGSEVLYRDIRFFNGPLSAYVHAGLFRVAKPLGGATLQNIKLFNAIVTWAIAMLIYRLVRGLTDGDDIAATTAGVGYLLMFALQQYNTANFNNITPYSYELPHGVGLSLLMIGCLWKASGTRSRQIVWISLAGLVLGLVFLTKAEVFVAALVAAIVGMFCLLRARAFHAREAMELIGIFLGYAIAPVVLALLLLSLVMSPAVAAAGLAGALKWLGDQRLMQMYYFRWLMGIENVEDSLLQMAKWTGAYACVFAIPAAIGWWLGRVANARRIVEGKRRGFAAVPIQGGAGGTKHVLQEVRSPQSDPVAPMPFERLFIPLLAIVVAAAIAAPLIYFWFQLPWRGCLRPLPLVMLIIAAVIAQMIFARQRSEAAGFVLPASMVALAGMLLAKIILNVHAFHYGFGLTPPAFVVLGAATVGWLPAWVARTTGSAAAAWVPKLAALAAIGLAVGVHVRLGEIESSRRTFTIGSGADRIDAEPKGFAPLVDAVVSDLKTLSTRKQTLVTIPEGLLINFFAKRANPSGHMNFSPPALVMFGEDQMLADLSARPPDYVIVANVDESIYSAPDFGKDYGRKIALWLRENYQPVKVYGALPYQEKGPGLLLMKRKSSGAAAATKP